MQPLRGSGQLYLTCGFGPDGGSLAAAGIGRAVEMWDLTDPGAPPRTFVAPEPVPHVGYRPDGTLVVVYCRNSLTLFDPATVRVLGASSNDQFWNSRAATSADGSRVVTAGDRLRAWDIGRGFHPQWDEYALRGQVFAGVAFSPESLRVGVSRVSVSPGSRSVVEVRRVESGMVLHQIPARGRRPDKLSWSPDGRLLAGLVDKHLTVWDADTWAEVFGPPERPGPGDWLSVLFHPNGRMLLTGGVTGA